MLNAFFALVLCGMFLLPFGHVYAQSAFDDPGNRAGKNKGGDLVAVGGKLEAGDVTLGSSSQVVILIRNDSGKPVQAGEISLYPSSNVSAKVGENECAAGAISPDAVCAIALSVQGLQPGKFRIEMLMRHEGRSRLLTSTITGEVERSEDTTRDVISDLETIPSELKFGNLKNSRPLTRSIILRNVTSKPIQVTDIEVESNDQAGYTFKTDCESLLSGEACIVTVTWAPQQRGPSTGVLVIRHDGPTGVVSVILDGEYDPEKAKQVDVFPEAVPGKGLLTASQTDIDFGKGVESNAAITVSLVNVGDTPLTLGAIDLSNKDNGVKISQTGCREGVELAPVEACPLTLVWEPVRVGAILDDVKIRHDGARGILVLPIRGNADKAVNKDSQAIVFGGEAGALLRAIPPVAESDVVGDAAPVESARSSSASVRRASGNASGALEGYKITSLARNRAIVSGPGGSRVIFDGEETMIGGVLWDINIRSSAVEFTSGGQTVLLLFDRSLSAFNSGGSAVSSSSSSESGEAE